MAKIKVLIIINPVAGNNNKFKVIKIAGKHLDSKRYDYQIIYTRHAGHAFKLSTDAVYNNYGMVVAVGGDGLINEVARGLTNSNTAMGIIPYGSGNGLARHLKIPLNTTKAIEILNNFNTINIDTFIINDEHLFCNMAGTGFDALVAKKFALSKKRGFIKYLRIIIKEFIKFKPREYDLLIDDKKIILKAAMVSFANSSQFGNNAIIAPTASVNDGKLDVCILKDFKWYQAPYVGFMLLAGLIHKTSFINYFKATDVKIIIPDGGVCHLDGDPMDLGNYLHIKLHKKLLKVVVPNN